MPAGFQDNIDPTAIPALAAQLLGPLSAFDVNVLDNPVGESVFDRLVHAQSSAATSGDLVLAGFTARATQTISQVRVWTNATAAAATPTLIRLGVYQRDPVTNIYTQIAATPTDLTLFAATNTQYSKAFSASFVKTAGLDYLVGLLIVSAAAMPTFSTPATGWSTAYLTGNALAFPQTHGKVAAQADLPTSISAPIAASAATFHAHLLQ